MGAAVVIVLVVAFCRYGIGFTPVWSEPVVSLLIFASVCMALIPGLLEGVHVAIHLLDLLGARWQRLRRLIGWALCLVFGCAMLGSAIVYFSDMFSLGLADYSGMPQWAPALGAVMFGLLLAAYAGFALVAEWGGRAG